jgi:hypothetical protein
MLKPTLPKFAPKQIYVLILGVAFGFTLEAILVIASSGSSSPFWLGAIVSFITYGAFALVLFGFFYRKGGERTLAADLLLGIGIGIILVWFIGATGT